MGDIRYTPFYREVREAEDPGEVIHNLPDEGVIAALAAASTAREPYLANVLATEAQNRARQKETIVETVGEGVVALDREGCVTFANSTAEYLLGWPVDSLIGRDFHNVVHLVDRDGEVRPRESCKILEVTRSRETSRVMDDDRFTRRDGSWFLAGFTTTPIEREGEVDGLVVAFQDITERRKWERRLQLTQTAVDRAGDAVFFVEADGSFAYVNEEACRTLGYARDELLALSVHDVNVEMSAADWPVHWDQVKREGVLKLQSVHRRKDGSLFPVEVTVNFVKFDDGEYHCTFARDVTRERERERALWEAHEALDAVFRASPLPMVALDPEGNVTLWNPAAERAFGWRADEVVGEPNPVVPPEKREEFDALRARVLAGEVLTAVPVERRRRDGSKVVIGVNAAPVRDREGNVTGIMSALSEIAIVQRVFSPPEE